tara:strand:- start:324 stop:1127 length:804 start_codon:yes stop_codon:yes gene_type:complete
VTYKSESIIHDCLSSLPNESKKIVIENSSNINLERELKTKYDNIEVVLSKNIGMGAGNNIGLKRCKTEYAYVLNPDTKLNNETIHNLLKSLNKIKDFTLASAINDNPKIPNYKLYEASEENEEFLSVDTIDGFSMFFNLKKFTDNNFFDENFFLYLENDDLCLRIKKNGGNIYVVKNSTINHKGSISKNNNLEYLRNWHWMWSKFYFNKKHYGFFTALTKIFLNLLSSILRYLFYILILNKHKAKIYKMRILGLYNSIIGKKSFFRL